METAWKGVLSRLKWSEIVSVVLIWEVERGNMFFQKLLFHLQECILRSQTVLDMHSTYICVPKNWIRSVERMAALTTIDAFSAVKSSISQELEDWTPVDVC
ncbi:PREDICTED: uncharacterized protein LOC102007544 isoform X5 [Chinchilla lanigera]|uniref:uncharacterized protein LOC102007544 isoform X5 n=1 Tax=Chinchilla lanigera TaxID=34839 RepID=UPI0006983842|nr:PREDICTED: uncharacterized protein LOC102007544 isoform X5 [Chinchilla lanigera]